jgi:hypothetical protein
MKGAVVCGAAGGGRVLEEARFVRSSPPLPQAKGHSSFRTHASQGTFGMLEKTYPV